MSSPTASGISEFSLNPEEHVIRVIHRHPINIFPVIVAVILVMLADLVGFYLLGRFSDSLPSFVSVGLLSVVLMVIAALMAIIGLVALFIFRQNRIVLTNQNLCQIEQFGLFGRKVAKLNLDDVQDVSGHRTGFWATIFNYGDVIVETAGEQESFIFHQAPDPTGIASFINQIHREYCENPKS